MGKRFTSFHSQTRLTILVVLMTGVVISMLFVFLQNQQTVTAPKPTEPQLPQIKKGPVEPTLHSSELIGGLSHPWDMVFLPDGTLLFNERAGSISKIVDGKKLVIANIADVYAVGEGGLTGLTLDSEFATNRLLYTCFNASTKSGLDVRLVRWKLSADSTQLTDRSDIVTGIPSNGSGRHSGCRVRAAKDGSLWVGTGDAAKASNPQDPKSLGGKIMHITRDGMPESGNLPAPFDPRIFSYGHRNVQGLVLFDQPKGGVFGYSIEHGSDVDDEVNLLKSGNFGWAPKATYVEAGIPMTDLSRFPDAISAIWTSGSPTIAPSGATKLTGQKWGTWNGAIAVAVLKGKQVRILRFDENNVLVEQKSILTEFGRVRSTTLDRDGNLYLTTDNGSNDKIIKVVPSGN